MTSLVSSIGDSRIVSIPMVKGSVAFSPDVSTGSLIFTAKYKYSDADSVAVFQKATGAGITVSGSNALISILRADTVNLKPCKLYIELLWQDTATLLSQPVAHGVLEITQRLTRKQVTSVSVVTTETPLPFGGGSGSSTYAALTDKATANLPAVNTPLATALAGKASLASPTFTGTVTAGGFSGPLFGNVTGNADTVTGVYIEGTIDTSYSGGAINTNSNGGTIDTSNGGGSISTNNGGASISTSSNGQSAGWLLAHNGEGVILPTNPADLTIGTAATVTSIGNLTGVVTSLNRVTAIADGALSIAKTSGLQTALAGKASLASPTFTGTVTAGGFAGPLTGNVTGSADGMTAYTDVDQIQTPLIGNTNGFFFNANGWANNAMDSITSTITGSLATTSNSVSVSDSVSPTVGQVLTATNATTAGWATPSGGAAGTLTGATLASNVLASSLTSTGTLTGGATGAGFTVALGTATITGTIPTANTAALTGDVTKSAGSNATTVGKINGTALSTLATGILKNTTSTGVPSIAVAADFPTLNQSTTGSAATITTARNINGVPFNGSADITVTAAAATLTGTTLPALSGAALTALNADNITTGRVGIARLVNTQTVGDANATIADLTRDVILTTALSVPRTYTLPLANTYPAGARVSFSDIVGTLGSFPATLLRAGTDTINGSTSIILSTANASVMLISDGSGKWNVDIRGVSRGGTGSTTAAGALANLNGAGLGANTFAGNQTIGSSAAIYVGTGSSIQNYAIRQGVSGSLTFSATSNSEASHDASVYRHASGVVGFGVGHNTAGGSFRGLNGTLTGTLAVTGNSTFAGKVSVTATTGRLAVIAGASSAKMAQVGGRLKEMFADVGNVTTTETDLHSYTLEAGLLGADGESLESTFGGSFFGSGSSKQIKVIFSGNTLFSSGTLAVSTNSSWRIETHIFRTSSTSIRYLVTLDTPGATGSSVLVQTLVGELTGLTLSLTNILKLTGTSAGVNAATNDIVAKLGMINWLPVSI